MLKRREFLKTCTLGTAAMLVPVGWAAPTTSKKAVPVISKDSYQALLNDDFRCIGQQGVAEKLTLVDIENGPVHPGLEQFSLIFKRHSSAGNKSMNAGLHRLYHKKTGPSLVNLVPSESKPGHYVTYFSLFA